MRDRTIIRQTISSRVAPVNQRIIVVYRRGDKKSRKKKKSLTRGEVRALSRSLRVHLDNRLGYATSITIAVHAWRKLRGNGNEFDRLGQERTEIWQAGLARRIRDGTGRKLARIRMTDGRDCFVHLPVLRTSRQSWQRTRLLTRSSSAS